MTLRTRPEARIMDVQSLRLWALSTHLAAQRFTRLLLCADQAGATLLIEKLRLPFTELHIYPGPAVPDEVAHVWAASKLVSYTVPDEPFVHLDHDVFLWKPLPERVTSAAVFAQNRERHEYTRTWYAQRIAYGVPWVGSPYNVGVIGGHDLDFIREYANGGLAAISDPRNRTALRTRCGTNASLHFEQLGLGCYAHARGRTITPLLSPNGREATQLGYTHLQAESKWLPRHRELVERELFNRDPALFERVNRYHQTLAADTGPLGGSVLPQS